jgi:hypothetical protein
MHVEHDVVSGNNVIYICFIIFNILVGDLFNILVGDLFNILVGDLFNI